MNTLRQAVDEYLDMRRHLGFQLREAGKVLPDFVAFMEQHRAPYITQTLALAWAQQPASAQPARWAQRLSYVRGFARYRRASDPRTQIPAPGPGMLCQNHSERNEAAGIAGPALENRQTSQIRILDDLLATRRSDFPGMGK